MANIKESNTKMMTDSQQPPEIVVDSNLMAQSGSSISNVAVKNRRRSSSVGSPIISTKRPGCGDDRSNAARKRRHSSDFGAVPSQQPVLILSKNRKNRGELFFVDNPQLDQRKGEHDTIQHHATLAQKQIDEAKKNGAHLNDTHSTSASTLTNKSNETKKLLLRVLGNNFLFSGISHENLERIIDSMTELKVEPGTVIIKEGDTGDNLYVIEYGVLEVIQSKCPNQIDVMEQGRVFGELALIYQSPRAATVRAANSSVLWSLHRQQYLTLEMDFMNENLDKRVSQLQNIDAFKNLTYAQLRRVSAVMQEESFQVGEVICRQGERLVRGVNDKFYTISKGSVRVTVASQTANGSVNSSVNSLADSDDGGNSSPDQRKPNVPGSWGTSTTSPRLTHVPLQNPFANSKGMDFADNTMVTTVAELHGGNWFGEMALLRDEPRTANVIALGSAGGEPVICYTLTRGAFEQIVSDSSAIETIASHSEVRKEDTNEVVLRHHRHYTAASITLGSLQISSVIGEGGFSVVRLVQNTETGQAYALKIMNKADLAARMQQDHVRNERRILLASSHPFILSLIRTFKDTNRLYMLFELVQGGELFSRVTKSNGGLPFENVRFYAACVTEGLSYLHKKGIAYRDLKLENLVIDFQGYLKIIDFGFAKHLGPGESTRTLCGTPDYLAPEAVTRQGHNHMVDCWGLGVLIYEMITQVSPFADPTGVNQMDVFRRIMFGPNAIDWRMFIDKYETALKKEVNNPKSDPALVEFIQRDYSHTRDMLHRLWDTNPGTRLSMPKLKEHFYFVPKISWADLREKKVTPPWVPNLTSPTDTTYFEVEDFNQVRESENVYSGPEEWFVEFGEKVEQEAGNGTVDHHRMADVQIEDQNNAI